MFALRSEIEEMFEPLQGCADTRRLLALPGMHVLNRNSGEKTPEQIRAHNRRPEVKAAKRAHDREYRSRPDVMVKKNESKRRKSLETNIQKWATDAKVILIGRDVKTIGGWLSVMTHPITAEERAAQVDFIFFLRQCRKCSAMIIANMLGINETEVNAALASRGVKLS
jgi:hypothetical protein